MFNCRFTFGRGGQIVGERVADRGQGGRGKRGGPRGMGQGGGVSGNKGVESIF